MMELWVLEDEYYCGSIVCVGEYMLGTYEEVWSERWPGNEGEK